MVEENELRHLRAQVERLEDALEDIARLAEGHARSVACDNAGRNIALSVIVAMVRQATGFDAAAGKDTAEWKDSMQEVCATVPAAAVQGAGAPATSA